MPYSHPLPGSPDGHEYSTRKRVGKACDSCRIKKSKCDGRKPCSRCTADDKICTFTERKKAKEKLYSSRYVELLENRIEILQTGMEELVRRVSRGDDISCLLSKNGHVSINRALDELTNKSFELQKEEHERLVDVHEDSEHDTDHDHHSETESVHDSDRMDYASSSSNSAVNNTTPSTTYGRNSSSLSLRSSLRSGSSDNVLAVGQGWSPQLVTEQAATNSPNGLLLVADPATIIRGHQQQQQQQQQQKISLAPLSLAAGGGQESMSSNSTASSSASMSPGSMTSASSLYTVSASPSPIDMQYVLVSGGVGSNDTERQQATQALVQDLQDRQRRQQSQQEHHDSLDSNATMTGGIIEDPMEETAMPEAVFGDFSCDAMGGTLMGKSGEELNDLWLTTTFMEI
ncbi:uncharacterized protein V1516DRAFT_686536 [Lipomyces oligophaga]|uniref:uncharacterized protein n=1 Tax=Lipomyces oligophaga TaxID=45792 RepID=UPI0034CF8AD5